MLSTALYMRVRAGHERLRRELRHLEMDKKRMVVFSEEYSLEKNECVYV